MAISTTTANGLNTARNGLQHLSMNGRRSEDASSEDSDGNLTPSYPSSNTASTTPDAATDVRINGIPAHMQPHRKVSAPLMPAFMVSAPGKVIVYGEHAVVHGKVRQMGLCATTPSNSLQAAIAASISLRSYLLVTFRSKSQRTVSLRFPDVDLDHTWNIDELPWAVFSQPSKKKTYYDRVTSLDQELLDALDPHVRAVSPDFPEKQRIIHQNSALAFLYLFLSIGSPQSASCTYTLRSTIPIGGGLGSSASVAVCLACALLVQIRALSGPHPDQPSSESALQIERINRWAFVGELCIHGNPSGVDNTVSSGGKAVLFQRKDYNKPPLVKRLPDFPELPLLVVNTKQARSTKVEVAKVGKLKETHPTIANSILCAIDAVTESAHNLISSDDFDPDDPASLQHLGELAAVNHGLLCSLGVSHPKLERVRAIIDHADLGWTKLTGAGGGGCAITIIKPDTTAATRAKVQQQLADEGFETFSTTLAGDGVGVLYPAVLDNGSGEVGGEEIDQEKFLKAPEESGIEKLVGVGAGNGVEEAVREGWRFWRPRGDDE